MIDLLLLLPVALLGLWGWRRGLLQSLLSLVALAAGYGAALLLYQPVGALLVAQTSLQPLLAYPAAGLLAFLLAQVVVGAAAALIRSRRRRQAVRPRHVGSRIGGALIGALYGAGLVCLAIWLLLAAQALAPEHAPDVRSTRLGRAAAPLAGRVTYAIVERASGSDDLAGAARQLVRQPRSAQRLLHVAGDRRMRAVLTDGKLLRAMARSDWRTLRRSKALAALAGDEDFVGAAQEAGLIEPSAERPAPEAVRRQLVEQLAPLARTVVALADDPEVRRLLAEPELRRRIEQQRLLELVNDPAFNRLVSIVVQRMRPSGTDQGAALRSIRQVR